MKGLFLLSILFISVVYAEVYDASTAEVESDLPENIWVSKDELVQAQASAETAAAHFNLQRNTEQAAHFKVDTLTDKNFPLVTKEVQELLEETRDKHHQRLKKERRARDKKRHAENHKRAKKDVEEMEEPKKKQSDWSRVKKTGGRVTRDAFHHYFEAKYHHQLSSKAEATAYRTYINTLFNAAISMMLPAKKDSVGQHCFGAVAPMAGEFYFGRKAPSKVLLEDWPNLDKDDEGRVTLATFKEHFKLKFRSLLTPALEQSYDKYLNSVFEAAVSMMLPSKKRTVGQHCYKYASELADEFYFTDWTAVQKNHAGRVTEHAFIAYYAKKNRGDDDYVQYLRSLFHTATRMMLPARKDTLGIHCFNNAAAMAGEFYFYGRGPGLDRKHYGRDWDAIGKDSHSRVNGDTFVKFFKKKYVTWHLAASKEQQRAFDIYLRSTFRTSTQMMLPKTKGSLGAHCFKWASMMAGEFYFEG